MTKHEFNLAVLLAAERSQAGAEMTNLEWAWCFGLPEYKPRVVTLVGLADLIRWQCVHIIGGGMDQDALNEIWFHRRKFLVVGTREVRALAAQVAQVAA
jgi:hypothetical protein